MNRVLTVPASSHLGAGTLYSAVLERGTDDSPRQTTESRCRTVTAMCAPRCSIAPGTLRRSNGNGTGRTWALARSPVPSISIRHLEPDSPHRRTLAAALETLDDLGFPATDDVLDAYAQAAQAVAEVDVPRVTQEKDPFVAAERLVVGTLLYEPVLSTLRRMAHEAVSGRQAD